MAKVPKEDEAFYARLEEKDQMAEAEQDKLPIMTDDEFRTALGDHQTCVDVQVLVNYLNEFEECVCPLLREAGVRDTVCIKCRVNRVVAHVRSTVQLSGIQISNCNRE